MGEVSLRLMNDIDASVQVVSRFTRTTSVVGRSWL